MATAYSEKLKDPRWQKKRLEILQRDDFTCQFCSSKEKTLHVHHFYYEYGLEPWEYPNESLLTLCHECHDWEEKHYKRVISQIEKLAKKACLESVTLDSFVGALSCPDFNLKISRIPIHYIFRHDDLVEEIADIVSRHLRNEVKIRKDGAN